MGDRNHVARLARAALRGEDPDKQGNPATLTRLEHEMLTPRQRTVIADESSGKRPVRWDLNPPQREEYSSDRAYMRGLSDYAQRLIDADRST